MTYSISTVLDLVRDRLDYAPGFTARDDMLRQRIGGVIRELKRKGICVETAQDSGEIAELDDVLLVADMTVWQHNNRDKAESDPPWLRQRLRDRWMSERRRKDEA